VRHPEGTPLVLFLHVEGDPAPVGVASLGIRRVRLEGADATAGWLADFVVDAAHRSFFPAMVLQRAMLREGRARHPVVMGMPNPNAVAVVERSGQKRVGEMVRRVRVVRSSGYLARYMPPPIARVLGAIPDRARMARVQSSVEGLTIEWLDQPDARFDDLWARLADSRAVIGRRDARYLHWRFTDCPLGTYRFLALTSGPDRQLAGYAVCAPNGRALMVHDFLCDPAFMSARTCLWDTVVQAAWREGYASAAIEVMGDDALHRELQASGWVERGRRPFTAALGDRKALLDPARWHATPADEDG
jgi:hypothetical protein